MTCDGSASRSKKIALEQERQDCLGNWHLHPEGEPPMTDRMTPTVPELKRITELANKYRQQLMADLAPEFPGREDYALAAANWSGVRTEDLVPRYIPSVESCRLEDE